MLVEPESATLRAFLEPMATMSSSELLKAELVRAVHRRAEAVEWSRGRLLDKATELLDVMDLFTLDGAVFSLAGHLDPVSVRALDALHVATALQVAPLRAFVSYDRRQLDAARRAGLSTVSPGAEAA